MIVAAALVVIANGIALLGVARNWAMAAQRIELTERELPLGYSGKENTGFDTSLPTGELYIGRQARVAYIAYEYEGPTWKRLESERQTQSGVNERFVAAYSHMVAVDAARV